MNPIKQNGSMEIRKMYYVLVYDIASAKRLPKALKICRKFLYWIQNSVFEGELTKSQYLDIKMQLLKVINKKSFQKNLQKKHSKQSRKRLKH